MKRRPSPALVVASVALFFSLTGTGLAAGHYLITSRSQIKPSVLRTLRGHAGAQGPRGVAGIPGATGVAGIDWSRTYLAWQKQPVSTDTPSAQAEAFCHPGDHAVTGGFQAAAALVTVSEIMPAAYAPDGTYRAWGDWTVVGHFDPTHDPDKPAPTEGFVQAWALCTP